MTEESRPASSMDNETRWTIDTKDSDDYYEPYGDGKKWKAINLFRKRDMNSIFYLQFCPAIISMALFGCYFRLELLATYWLWCGDLHRKEVRDRLLSQSSSSC